MIIAVGTNEQYVRLCQEAGLGELADDPRFQTNPDRVAHRAELSAALSEAIAKQPRSHWLDVLKRSRVPGGAVRSIPEVFEHAPFAIHEQTHPSLGIVKSVRSPIGLDGVHPTSPQPPPLLGQHTDEVLRELGLHSNG